MKPILFNTEMVQAILEGRKTVTRRVLKLPNHVKQNENGLYTLFAEGTCYENQSMEEIKDYIKPPYAAGDILYVRETWQKVFETEYNIDGYGGCKNIRELISNFDEVPKVCVGLSTECSCPLTEPRNKYYVYKASNIKFSDKGLWWKPSIHMPKAAARIFLKVTNVRVERLQDMTSKEDFKKEGIYDDNTYPTDRSIKLHPMCQGGWTKEAYKERFEMIWNSTIKKDEISNYSWSANPYVWVIEFERISKEEAEHGETN